MSSSAVIDFLRSLATRPDLCARLRDRPKDEVIAAAAETGHSFSEAEFNEAVWELEGRLAEWRGELFDERFPLWQLLWGTYYLDFLVFDLVPSLDETGLLIRSEQKL